MNKIIKIIVAMLGAFDKVMSIFIPITVALLLLVSSGASMGAPNSIIIMIVAIGASMFRAIKPWLD